MKNKKSVLLFASGGGSNVEAILNYFKNNDSIVFPAIITNNPKAKVMDIAAKHGIDCILLTKPVFESDVFIDTIDYLKPDLLVLAGFLWKIPSYMVEAYPNKIVNIHPSLLPKYGGKGMYGHFVHEAVIAHGETESGITIHFVNQQYDEGTILIQKKIEIAQDDDATSLAKKVLFLEHSWYSQVIEGLLKE
ncbi:MAG: phosphoribosylglycinamide formyltransferase [Chitinophagaceae bacterium]